MGYRRKHLFPPSRSGHMGRGQLKDKIKAHYIGKGAYRVVFWTGTAEYAHWKNLATIKCLERNRLNLLFEVDKESAQRQAQPIAGSLLSRVFGRRKDLQP